MQHEIETCRAERAALDEKILMEMDETERRNAALRTMEQDLVRKGRETTQGKTRLDGEAQDLGRQVAALEGERQEIMTGIAPAYLDPFVKVARQRKGLALVAVRDERCGGCHVRVMPKLIQQVRRATGLIACDSCKRFLYVPDEPSTVAGAAAESPAQ